MTTKLSKQTINLPQLILRLAELGLDEGEIMYSLELTRRKFNALKRRKSISDALTTGLETRARRVEDALYRRATGFEYEETVNAETKPPSVPPLTKGGKSRTGNTSISYPPHRGTGGSLKSSAKSTIKTVPPDVTAIIFWLKNRMPDKWREGKELTSGKRPFIESLELYDKTHDTDENENDENETEKNETEKNETEKNETEKNETGKNETEK